MLSRGPDVSAYRVLLSWTPTDGSGQVTGGGGGDGGDGGGGGGGGGPRGDEASERMTSPGAGSPPDSVCSSSPCTSTRSDARTSAAPASSGDIYLILLVAALSTTGEPAGNVASVGHGISEGCEPAAAMIPADGPVRSSATGRSSHIGFEWRASRSLAPFRPAHRASLQGAPAGSSGSARGYS